MLRDFPCGRTFWVPELENLMVQAKEKGDIQLAPVTAAVLSLVLKWSSFGKEVWGNQ